MGKIRGWKLGLIIVGIFFLSGCASTTSCGIKLDRNKVSQIQKGITTLAEVEALFGPLPESVQLIPDGSGRRAMCYSFVETSSTPTPETYIFGPFVNDTKVQTTIQTLTIIVNKADIIEDYTFKDDIRNNKISVGFSDVRITPIPVTQGKK